MLGKIQRNMKSTKTKPSATKSSSKSLKLAKSVQRDQLETYLADLLKVQSIKDYCPNGLQVQGKPVIKKVITGVTASLALVEAAIQEGADAIVVHHGWFWKNDDTRVVGQLHARLKLLMDHQISLFAYHLPLDLHPRLGNNAQLAKLMGWTQAKGASSVGGGAMDGLIWSGKPSPSQKNLGQLARSMASRLGRDPLVVGDLSRPVKNIAWCTGAAQGYISEVVSMKVDAYISGEISEPTFHTAQEMGVAYIAAGHHATERYGVQALGQEIAKKWGITHQFIDIHNPV
jgi:dinuclear metal center YbgI/SA1388 family protein